MNYNNHVHFTARPAVGFKIRQQPRRRKALGFPGGSALWFCASKVACTMLFVVLGASFWLGSVTKQTYVSIQNIEAQQYTIRDKQISLLAQRAQLMSEQNVYQQARVELALVVPNDKQVKKIR